MRSCDFTFQQIYFAAGESRIQKHQRWGLDQNASGLLDKACGGYARRLELAGHADATETDAARLALERARVVERYLVSKGVARDRLRVRGYGSRRPVRRGTAPADLATNRRVEFVVLEPAKPPSAK